MFGAAAKALAQMFTPPFRAVLLKSIGLAILLLILFGIGLHRLFAWLAAEGAGYLEGVTGPGMADAAACADLGARDRCRIRACCRRGLHHAGHHGVRRELLLRRDRRRGRAHALPGRSAGRCRAAPRLPGSRASRPALLALIVYLIARAVLAVRRHRVPDRCSSRTRTCSAANISCSPRCASIRSRRPSALRRMPSR